MGGNMQKSLRPDWEEVKVQSMYEAKSTTKTNACFFCGTNNPSFKFRMFLAKVEPYDSHADTRRAPINRQPQRNLVEHDLR
eukprot:CAMPEP_0175169944 /NCGR_PEP_ID=MMETSP0087-20121206/29912_1 /TAXON_ID=136419 /ORGANISM="Unknown Unknown, Strain D1" /LENGTH=80 /DNA_ID=CAMNT_0016460467 /DNA_START=30 /DNA_END=272 /DNA_ORIENTATION=+